MYLLSHIKAGVQSKQRMAFLMVLYPKYLEGSMTRENHLQIRLGMP